MPRARHQTHGRRGPVDDLHSQLRGTTDATPGSMLFCQVQNYRRRGFVPSSGSCEGAEQPRTFAGSLQRDSWNTVLCREYVRRGMFPGSTRASVPWCPSGLASSGSGLPCRGFIAVKLCPDLVFVRPNFQKYQRYSEMSRTGTVTCQSRWHSDMSPLVVSQDLLWIPFHRQGRSLRTLSFVAGGGSLMRPLAPLCCLTL